MAETQGVNAPWRQRGLFYHLWRAARPAPGAAALVLPLQRNAPLVMTSTPRADLVPGASDPARPGIAGGTGNYGAAAVHSYRLQAKPGGNTMKRKKRSIRDRMGGRCELKINQLQANS